VGSKFFTEQDLLGELVAVWIERTTDLEARRRLHLGGTFVCHRALENGEIDLYVEYTGTALTAILDRPPVPDPDEVLGTVRRVYRDSLDLIWTEPLGFENTFALLVRRATADSLDLETISDAAPHAGSWVPGMGYEFVEREDGLPGLVRAYDLSFASGPRTMELGLLYRALADRQVDVIAGNSTDGRIEALDLVHLRDDPDQAVYPLAADQPADRHQEDLLFRQSELPPARRLEVRLSDTQWDDLDLTLVGVVAEDILPCVGAPGDHDIGISEDRAHYRSQNGRPMRRQRFRRIVDVSTVDSEDMRDPHHPGGDPGRRAGGNGEVAVYHVPASRPQT
jgi:glycine betaine/choline ABC-type transport system substrate-binding protein